MDIATAAAEIATKYPIRGSGRIYEVPTGVYDRGWDGISLLLIDVGGTAVLTDCADVANGVGDRLTEEQIISLAERFGFHVTDWHIEKTYTGPGDIGDFIRLLGAAEAANALS